ncbi:YeeE/YedE family protein [Maledivibacter halophilus]|uniref:Uncharacterized protein n=1 Tax=Maledivibacter halophilus TaxID=36842 RepID=A0A1T5MRN4_9FIRM|nr:YeeE/YedE family protein [Maledivibacter halophilus]SKC90875.1 hypothetical protein SAMN02194393_05229 [Maledivibacter halophilus]
MKILKRIFNKPWPYLVGGIILAALNIILFAFSGEPWRITTGFLYWGMGILENLGVDHSKWYYFNVFRNDITNQRAFFNNEYTILNLGLVFGALIAALLASEFKWKRMKNKKQLIFGLIGGVLMGYGSRLSFGCNIGAYFSAVPSFSLHGWVYGIFMFIGAFIGSKLLFKYLL